MRQIDLTLYNINPVGVQESLERADYYEAFLKGVAKPERACNSAIWVFRCSLCKAEASRSSRTATLPGMIKNALPMSSPGTGSPSIRRLLTNPNEYHHIEIRLDQRGLIRRTRDGYYANPRIRRSAK